MEFSSLSNLLGAVIGFAGVILVLSLVVTGLAQCVQAPLKLRGRATQAAAKRLLMVELGLRKHEAARFAVELVKPAEGSSSASLKTPPPVESSWWVRFWGWIRGPKEHIISQERLKEVLAAPEHYANLQARTSARFTAHMRLITGVSALAVAFALQISVQKLFRDLSVPVELKAQALKLEQNRLEAANRAGWEPKGYRQVAEPVLTQLSQEFGELVPKLEQVSGAAVDKDDALSELALILDGHPKKAEVLARYAALIDEHTGAQRTEQALEAPSQTEKLASIDFGFWREGNAFYWNQAEKKPVLDNVIGVLLTSILLSFGAPLWYELLKRFGAAGDPAKRRLRQVVRDEAGH